jgi:hypothetical protein
MILFDNSIYKIWHPMCGTFNRHVLINKKCYARIYAWDNGKVHLVCSDIQYLNRVFIQKPILGSKLNKTHGSLE